MSATDGAQCCSGDQTQHVHTPARPRAVRVGERMTHLRWDVHVAVNERDEHRTADLHAERIR